MADESLDGLQGPAHEEADRTEEEGEDPPPHRRDREDAEADDQVALLEQPAVNHPANVRAEGLVEEFFRLVALHPVFE